MDKLQSQWQVGTFVQEVQRAGEQASHSARIVRPAGGTCGAQPRLMAPRDLKERTRLSALSVFMFCRSLPGTDEAQEAALQLRRAANSERSNYRAARNGRSRKEFASKLGEAYEEADESRDWLQYLHDSGISSNPTLPQEAQELTKIFAKSLQTTRSNTARMNEAGTIARSRRRRTSST